jgi:hypothetical protein
MADLKTNAHLFRDSTYGIYPGKIELATARW